MNECLSCGEKFLPHKLSEKDEMLSDDAKDILRELLHLRCRTCAQELAGITIPRIGSTMHGTGGGTRVIRSGREMS